MGKQMKMWNTGETKGGRELKKWNYRGGGKTVKL